MTYQRYQPYISASTKPRVRFDWKEGGWYVATRGYQPVEVFRRMFGKNFALSARESGRSDGWGPILEPVAIPFRADLVGL